MLLKKLQIIITTLDPEHNEELGGFTVEYNDTYITYFVIKRENNVSFPGIYIIPKHIDTICRFQPAKSRNEIKKQMRKYTVFNTLKKLRYNEKEIKYILC